jgi:hypothetical protein
VHSDKTTGTALTQLTATQSDETCSIELATITGKPGSLYQRREGNTSAASSEQVIASAGTECSGRGVLSSPRIGPSLSAPLAAATSASTCPPPTCPFWSLT